MNRTRRIAALSAVVLGVLLTSALGSWDHNGTPICTESGAQFETVIIPDGASGAIIAWTDARGPNGDIYAQRINEWGEAQWAPTGVKVGGTTSSDYQPRLVPDGAGGAFVVWLGSGTSAQRIDADGNLLWDSSGVAIDTATSLAAGALTTSTEYSIDAVSDGAGGVIAVYQPYLTTHLRAQRLDGSGNLLWPGGAPVCTLVSAAFKPAMAADGAGGAVIAWEDTRFDIQSDVFAQRIDASGTPVWGPNGVGVATEANYQENVYLASDGAGGAILTWRDLRTNSQTYAQHLDASGTPLWTAGGKLVIDGPAGGPGGIVADGAGGAIIVASRNLGDADVVAQRVNAAGDTLWTGPALVCTAPGNQLAPTAVSDGEGGVFIAWEDWRLGGRDIFAQRMDTTGVMWWNPDGDSVCTETGWQLTPAIASIGGGKSLMAWDDRRTGSFTSNYDVYAQRMVGVLVGVTDRAPRAASLAILRNTPNPFNATTDLVVELSAPSPVRVEIYDVLGRRVRVFEDSAAQAGVRRIPFDGRDGNGRNLASGVYFYRVAASGAVSTSKMIIQR